MSDEALEFAPLAVELFVPNVAEAVSLYTDKLGFRLVRADPEGATTFTFALIALGSAVFMFMQESFYAGADRPLSSERGDGVDIRIMVPDVDAMHARVTSAGMTITHDIADRDYGLRDFIARDPWGFRLRFASPLRCLHGFPPKNRGCHPAEHNTPFAAGISFRRIWGGEADSCAAKCQS